MEVLCMSKTVSFREGFVMVGVFLGLSVLHDLIRNQRKDKSLNTQMSDTSHLVDFSRKFKQFQWGNELCFDR